MMQSEKKITKDNAFELIKKFAKEYRRELGKAPAEIIIVGGGSIMLNYGFREATEDFDVILKADSAIKDIIARFADENDLPRDWMNTDFMRTEFYSPKLMEVSVHYRTLNNNSLEIRTISGVYLIAMKLRSQRKYRNDISDITGIIIGEAERGTPVTTEKVIEAYEKLYNTRPESDKITLIEEKCSKTTDELRIEYINQKNEENVIGEKLVTYIENDAGINSRNVDEVVSLIKEKMRKETEQ